MAIKLDTLAIAKELESAGIPVQQAEAQTRVYARVMNAIVDEQIATKQDVAILKQDMSILKQDVHFIKQKTGEVDKRLQKLETEMHHQFLKVMVRLGSLIVTAVIVLGALVKL